MSSKKYISLGVIASDFKVLCNHIIRIHRGSEIKTTHPKGNRIAKRDYIVITHTSSGDFTDDVTWVGSGKHWFWTKKMNCELLKIDKK